MKVELVIPGDNSNYDHYVNLAELDVKDYLIATDKFGRRFKLEPVTNENIKFPFIVTPLREEK